MLWVPEMCSNSYQSVFQSNERLWLKRCISVVSEIYYITYFRLNLPTRTAWRHCPLQSTMTCDEQCCFVVKMIDREQSRVNLISAVSDTMNLFVIDTSCCLSIWVPMIDSIVSTRGLHKICCLLSAAMYSVTRYSGTYEQNKPLDVSNTLCFWSDCYNPNISATSPPCS